MTLPVWQRRLKLMHWILKNENAVASGKPTVQFGASLFGKCYWFFHFFSIYQTQCVQLSHRKGANLCRVSYYKQRAPFQTIPSKCRFESALWIPVFGSIDSIRRHRDWTDNVGEDVTSCPVCCSNSPEFKSSSCLSVIYWINWRSTAVIVSCYCYSITLRGVCVCVSGRRSYPYASRCHLTSKSSASAHISHRSDLKTHAKGVCLGSPKWDQCVKWVDSQSNKPISSGETTRSWGTEFIRS